VYVWRILGATWKRKGVGQRAIVEKVASRKSKPKGKSREALETTQIQRLQVIKGAGSVARRVTLQLPGAEVVKSVAPQNCRELREFLKRANHYCRFVKDYAAVVTDKCWEEVVFNREGMFCSGTLHEPLVESTPGAQFEVMTDHQALSKMFEQAESPIGKLARWVSKMQPSKPFNVKCWSSCNSDALSRELKTR